MVWLFVTLAVVVLLATYIIVQRNTAPEPPVQMEQPQTETGPQPSPEAQAEIETVTGEYVGRADNNFIEIMANNTPMAFLAPYEKEKDLGITDVTEGGNATVDYFVNEQGQNVLVKMRPK